ncbi:hypothetical protein COL922a_012604 [Colletotrichum nupharicola]|nr:hypothetical protein COL922a_012604 [Colletotrichum nupharicola]
MPRVSRRAISREGADCALRSATPGVIKTKSHRRLKTKSSTRSDQFKFEVLHPDDATTREREVALQVYDRNNKNPAKWPGNSTQEIEDGDENDASWRSKPSKIQRDGDYQAPILRSQLG